MKNHSLLSYFKVCFELPTTYYHFVTYVLVNVPFVLPLCLHILGLGLQRWRSAAKISHSDFLTYNVVLVQLLNIVGCCLININIWFYNGVVTVLGIALLFVTYSAIVIFQIFTCLDFYFAVVHPVTYLSLKSQSWMVIRKTSCALVWLQCVLQSINMYILDSVMTYLSINLLGYSVSILIGLFCNLCVLRVLARPRPGGSATGSTSKRRAFLTLTAISATLLVKFGGDVFSTLSYLMFANAPSTDQILDKSCVYYFSVIWFTLPSSLVLPLLFLYRKKANK